MPEQKQPSEEEIKAFQEKLAKMSPEEKEQFFRQQCIFCQIIDGKIPSTKLYNDDKCIAILDINPANEGHVLLMPKKHFQVGPQVPDDIMKHMGKISKGISNACLKALKCAGTNIFIANGGAAGQQAQHFMIHIIPRYEKDGLTCFNLSENKVDDSSLGELAMNLKKYIAAKLKVEITEEEKKEEIKKTEEKIEPVEDNNVKETEKEEEPIKNNETKEKPVKEKGYLYFVDKDGDVARCKMVKGRKKEKQKQEKIIKTGVERQPGLLYYVDKDLNIKTSPMNRKGRKPSKKKKEKNKNQSQNKTAARKPKEKKEVKEAEFEEKRNYEDREEEKVSLDDISNLFG